MQPLDWIIVAAPLLIVFAIGLVTRRYMAGVSDFLTAGRGAGRYLLAISRAELQGGAAIFVASFEITFHAGFTLIWWQWVTLPIGVIVAISGFVFYRYRETRAMTLAQFFELRYSKSFRVFAGVVGFFAGVVNFAVIPVVGARIICYYLGFPPTVACFSLELPTEILVLIVLLSLTTILTLSGGLVTVLITNGAEGILSLVLYLVITWALLHMFSWSEINEVLTNHPSGQSFLNPLDTSQAKDFNVWYVLMNLALSIYGTMAWQNQGAYNSAGTTAHESRMASIMGRLLMYKPAMTVLLATCAMAFLFHPHYAAQAREVQAAIAQIPDDQTREQVLVPVALSHLLPTGIRGALCVIFIMGLFGGDSAAMHSWGSLFIQDILVPLRRRPFAPRQHVFYLRLSIIGVALFAFIFGSFFRQTEYLQMYWTITMAIYIGGAGAAIIGGLYWKKGTAQGAWCAMVFGSIFSVTGIAWRIYHPQFFLNPVQISFIVTATACAIYISVSLLTCREDFNMDRMLHRGAYAKITPAVGDATSAPSLAHRPSLLARAIGMDENFTRGDKACAILVFGWNLLWFAVFIVGSIWNFVTPWPVSTWSAFWHVAALVIPITLNVVSSIWFTWGGLRDVRNFFRHLRERRVNPLDDGTVVDHQNLDETALTREKPSPVQSVK